MADPRASPFALVLVGLMLFGAERSRGQTIVFVADGAGDFRCCSTTLRRAATFAGAPLVIETLVWSHGYLRSVADQVHESHAHLQGQRLAAVVIARQAAKPAERVCLVGHSAGCAVVLAAAERLPPDSLGCMVLLAPSQPADYDLSAALRASRGGIHAFCSRRDCWIMRAVTFLEMLKSGRLRRPAGRIGFFPPAGACANAIYARLRNYPWGPALAGLGHDGGHFGSYQPAFAQAFVLPLLDDEQSRDRQRALASSAP